ncbi:leucine rich repeat domain protein [Aspergillus homomorphus CBS 101889]|uniref:Leucine rich repeat domain protein n=1 Tax=Aspergillus homomorphus (strain CBS 101889) TaxID=1450537 RepID=A0A395HPG8_ASPHC|nr:leucine rich repeat domain protein [Aspergillus homomorphus CBS 101889]RAL09516.1 leucine rich repeat domain protein [Aspergillus homomorphus CBS 101889]
MDTVPPSYQAATARDAWSIIAQYIPSSDLCAAALVSRRWHELFMPFLWGDPASHFGTENDAFYVAMTRFRRTLKYARLEVRMLTHTLHLPPALSEIYGGPRPEWLREILDSLPCLQSLMVSELPFFDHNAMMALKGASPAAEDEMTTSCTYNVRLLLADSEYNTTSQGIAETLLHFPELTYLDLSYTTPARDRLVLSALSQLERLQVLKLRGIGLKDNDAEFLANAISYRVRFLDLRNNHLTDMAVRSLLQACFRPTTHVTAEDGPRRSGTWGSLDGSQLMPALSLQKFLSCPMLDEQYMIALTQPLTGRSWVEDLTQVGITHLYIADNPISVEGAASLLASSRLHALDVGTVDTADSINRQHSLASSHENPGQLPGAEKLIPVLGSNATNNLTYLRAHHALCTAEAPAKEATSPDALLAELPAESADCEPLIPELDPTNEIHELPSESGPIYELPATPVSQPSSSSSRAAEHNPGPTIYEDEPLPEQRRGSIFAPEVVGAMRQLNGDELSHSELTTSPFRLPHGLSISSISSITDSVVDTMGSATLCSSPVALDDPRAQKVQELLSKRPKGLPRRNSRRCHYCPYLHPSHVSHLEQLVLTDVPSHVPANSPILASLIRFITACSNETLLATLQARSDYSLPPGQARLQAEQERARSLFALRRIVLEITPTPPHQGRAKLTPWKPTSYQTGAPKSSTGDRDLENLWSAADDDFSFFGEEECGVPDGYSGKYFPMAVLNEKVSLMPEDDDIKPSGHPEANAASSPIFLNSGWPLSPQGRSRTTSLGSTPATTSRIDSATGNPQPEVPMVDLVAELAAFRRAKKMEYEDGVRRGRRRGDTVGTTATSHLSPSTTISSFRSPSPSPSFTSLAGSSASTLSITKFVEGHWKGEMKVIRNPAPKGRSGVVDMYGNYFEKGYLYP